MEMESTDIIICGCGPTGALLSAYLGRHNVKNVILERETEIVQDPRGIALDEDGIRCLQGVGLYEKVFTEIGQVMGYFNFISSATSLHASPFLRFNYRSVEGGTAHPGFMCHKQPAMERCLRDVISAQPECELRSGATVRSIEETAEHVLVTYSTSNGDQKQIRAKFMVGADGKTGYTRKNYLEPRGITLEKDEKFTYEEAWVAVNLRLTPPTPDSHPDFPLWRLGFTPEQVYDSFFPLDFRFICNPDRPSVCGRFGLPEDRLWRFEFVVKAGEDGSKMAQYESLCQIVFPYLTHSGKLYGIDTPVSFPRDCMEIIRSRPFKFSARSCDRWALGRVILCGDSAHVFPPFGGQGITSGFRDAISVAWRLKVACRPGFARHEQLFEAWYGERKQQLDQSLAATIRNGNYCNERSAVKTIIRDWSLWLMQHVPRWRHQLELGQRQEGMTTYTWKSGYPFLPSSNGGQSLPQVFCVPCSSSPKRPLFTDDLIFAREKIGLFQIVVLLNDLSELTPVKDELARLKVLCSNRDVDLNEATFLVSEDGTADADGLSEADLESVFRIVESVESFPGIWHGLPDPLFYDGTRLRREIRGKFVIVRPDRFVYAVCHTESALLEALKSLAMMFDQ